MDNLFESLSDRRGKTKQTLKRKLVDAQRKCNHFDLQNTQNDNTRRIPKSDTDHCPCAAINGAREAFESLGFKIRSDIDEEIQSNDEVIIDESEDEIDSTNDENFFGEFLEDLISGDDMNILDDLLFWCLEYNIRNKAISHLLKILIKYGLDVPKDARTLKYTPREIITKEVDPGAYWHFGVKATIDFFLENGIKLPENLTIDVNIDGVPLHVSSKGVLWPILGKFSEVEEMKPFVIGIYHDTELKPKDINRYLDDFISEMLDFEKETYMGIQLSPGLFILDAAAMAFVKKIKQHNGYKSCPNCLTEGIHGYRRMSFPDLNIVPRTDRSFRDREDFQHHNNNPEEEGPLERLNIDMIENFGPDYLHICLLGGCKKTLSMLTSKLKFPKINELQRVIFSNTDFPRIEKATALCALSKPIEIHRAIRQLSSVLHFKGTEFRTFILYYGIIVLKDNVNPLIYKNFVYFHCALTICLTDKYRHFIPLAEQLFKTYVDDFKQIYGTYMCSFNIHQLLHIAPAVKRLGSLERFSAFPYESKLGEIKNSICSGNNPLQQAANRTMERLKLDAHNLRKALNQGKFIKFQ